MKSPWQPVAIGSGGGAAGALALALYFDTSADFMFQYALLCGAAGAIGGAVYGMIDARNGKSE